MSIRTGGCLCGARRYEVAGDFDGVWVCHCSLCRKATGSVGNAILIVPRERFRWLAGEDHGVTFALRPSYAVTRCKTCGTPLPAETDKMNVYVTAGTAASMSSRFHYAGHAILVNETTNSDGS